MMRTTITTIRIYKERSILDEAATMIAKQNKDWFGFVVKIYHALFVTKMDSAFGKN
jgi:hypothetical protein